MLFELVVGSGLQLLEDFCIGSLSLPIVARMRYGGKEKFDAHVLVAIPEEIARELDSIIGDDPTRNPEPGHQIFDELEH